MLVALSRSGRRQLARRLSRALARHGGAGTLRLGLRLIRRGLVEWNTHDARAQRRRHRSERRFDRRFGVDTAGIVRISALDITAGSAAHGRHYSVMKSDIFHAGLRSLPIDPSDFTFVDLGSGKGRALLEASEYGFRRIVGVEYSEELHLIAEKNIARYRSRSQRCCELRSVCADAAEFSIPEGALLCFLNNPFGAAILARVVENLRRSLELSPRDLYILYMHPVERRVLEEADFLLEIGRGDHYLTYRNRLRLRRPSGSR